jgi:uncharacterized protein (TIGR03067 family)
MRRWVMWRAVLIILAAGLAPGPSVLGQEPIQQELKGLQGTWTLVSYQYEGKKLCEDQFEEMFGKGGSKAVLKIEGDKLKMGEHEFSRRKSGPPREGTYQLDTGQRLKAFDITLPRDTTLFRAGWLMKGIYRVKGDRLEVCVVLFPHMEGPVTDFSTEPRSWRRLLVYERARPAPK